MSRVLVTGSRTWRDSGTIRWTLLGARLVFPTAVLVHGDAVGADRMAADVWRSWGLPVEAHPARWNELGKSAGFVRNREMVALGADACYAFIHNGSRGATSMARLAEGAGIRTVRLGPGYADVVDKVLRIVHANGYAIIGPARRVHRVEEAGVISAVPVDPVEAAVVYRLLDSGMADLDRSRLYHCGRFEGPGYPVIPGKHKGKDSL